MIYSQLPNRDEHEYENYTHPAPLQGIASTAYSCRCRSVNRLYAAISLDLNYRVLAKQHPYVLLQPFVFKVGSLTHHCAFRSFTLNNVKAATRGSEGQIVKDGTPMYADVSDWRIIRCWEVDQPDYDRRTFVEWFRSARPEGFEECPRIKAPSAEKSSGLHEWQELYSISPTLVTSTDLDDRSNDPLSAQLLRAVSDAIAELVSCYVRAPCEPYVLSDRPSRRLAHPDATAI